MQRFAPILLNYLHPGIRETILVIPQNARRVYLFSDAFRAAQFHCSLRIRGVSALRYATGKTGKRCRKTPEGKK